MARNNESRSNKGCLLTLIVLAIIAGLVYYFWPTPPPPDDGNGGSDQVSNSEPVTFTVNGESYNMVFVKGGTFTMGATSEQNNEADTNEKPTHKVTLSDYYIGQTEVTQGLWQAVMGNNPSHYSSKYGYPENWKHPVECVTWNACQEFITKLNKMTGKQFRLPTEAEWEYAARGGNKSKGYKYAGSNILDEVAWFLNNKDVNNSHNEGTRTVGTKKANELGIYDMSGNVNEWCQDQFGVYSSDPQTNPKGPAAGIDRVCRGGHYCDGATRCRLSARRVCHPSSGNAGLGLRLALSCD